MGEKKLSDLLVKEQFINVSNLEKIKKIQEDEDTDFISALILSGEVDEKQMAKHVHQNYKLPLIDLSKFAVDSKAVESIPRKICEKYGVFPVQKSGQILVVAFFNPDNLHFKSNLSQITSCTIQPVIDTKSNITAAINKYYGSSFNQMEKAASEILFDQVGVEEKDDPLINFVSAMLEEAIKISASDIHIEPYEKYLRVRFRVDGSLRERIKPPKNIAKALVSRIKIMSKLNIAERRLPQDGRMKVKISETSSVDLRVSSLPTMFGEKVVLRILDKSNLQVDMSKLGFDEEDLKLFKKNIYLSQGILLLTGPTGSGKTTTIYSALSERNTPGVNISTVEDPVEFNIDGINQVQVHNEIDFTYAKVLRALLRQDPDVIMVGEIRDLETASIAYKAAATGHLVLSTLHTNDSASTVTRLLDIGIEPFIISDSTSMIIAQRLLKTNCLDCITDISVNEETLLRLGVKKEHLGDYKNLKSSEGCSSCHSTGLKGRVAIFEVMQINETIQDAMFRKLPPMEIKKVAIASGMTSLRQAALNKLKKGITTVAQVISTTVED